MGPYLQSDGHDSPRLIDDAVPSFAGGIEDILVGLEGAVGEVGLSQELPKALDRVQFGGAGAPVEIYIFNLERDPLAAHRARLRSGR